MNQEEFYQRLLTNDAYNRFLRLKTYNPAKWEKAKQIITAAYSSGKIRTLISDEDFVKLLQSTENGEESDAKIEIKKFKNKQNDLDDLDDI